MFRGFNGRLVAKSPCSTTPGPKKITYDQFLLFMHLWCNGVMVVLVEAFRNQFATQSERSGGASTASNAGGAMGTTRRLEVLGSAKALYEDSHAEVVADVAGCHGSPEDPGARRADRVRVHWCPAGDGEGRAAHRRCRCTDGSFCLVVKRRECREVEHLFVTASRWPLDQPRHRILLSLDARTCIRYLPMWYWCGAWHGYACVPT